ncbi:MAG TPA: hypothetical protein VH257_17990, partial [Chloroflexota bacterium]|nr:hypothetical protein [Chloroflexota bacterium]
MRGDLFHSLLAKGPRSGPGPGPLGGALALVVAGALLAGGTSAVPASAQAPGPREGVYGAPFDLRLVPLRERRGEGEWPPPEHPWLASQTLLVPPGFRASLYAKFETANVRGLALGPSGVLFVSRPQDGAIDLLVDGNQDGFAEVRDQVLGGLDCPHGLAVSGGWLYAAQMHRVERFPLSGGNGAPSGAPAGAPAPEVSVGRQGELLADDLPDGPCADHGYRSIAVDPAKNALYVGVGMLCNVCIEEGPGAEKLATVRRYPLPSPGTAAPAPAAPGAPS